MALNIKLDEPLSDSLALFVERYGYRVATVRGQGWGGLKDPVLWPNVVAAQEFFITADKGFGDLRAYPLALLYRCYRVCLFFLEIATTSL